MEYECLEIDQVTMLQELGSFWAASSSDWESYFPRSGLDRITSKLPPMVVLYLVARAKCELYKWPSGASILTVPNKKTVVGHFEVHSIQEHLVGLRIKADREIWTRSGSYGSTQHVQFPPTTRYISKQLIPPWLPLPNIENKREEAHCNWMVQNFTLAEKELPVVLKLFW